MPRYSYNNIIFVINITLELLSYWLVHPGAPQPIILSFLTRIQRQENNESL